MPKKYLTHQFIKGIGEPEKPIEYYDTGDGETGLILRVSKAGTKTFAYRYRVKDENTNKDTRRFTIGRFPDVSLKDARLKVKELKVAINNGIDPQQEKKNRRYKPNELTFKELTQKFSEQFLARKAKSTREEYQRQIDNEFLGTYNLGDIPISEFTSQHIREVLYHKGREEESYTMANRMRATLSRIFEFGLKNVGIKLAANPVDNTPLFEQGENVRSRVYNDEEIKELWKFWETFNEPVQSYYKILLLTGQRKTETMLMEWSHIIYDKDCYGIKIEDDGKPNPEPFLADIWYKPEENTKKFRAHEIPLPKMVLDILKKLEPITGDSKFVFESPKKPGNPLSSVSNTTRDIKEFTSVSDFQLHDLRRTCNTRLQALLVEKSVRNQILNHKEQGTSALHYEWYRYTDKMLEALNRWSWRVESIISGE